MRENYNWQTFLAPRAIRDNSNNNNRNEDTEFWWISWGEPMAQNGQYVLRIDFSCYDLSNNEVTLWAEKAIDISVEQTKYTRTILPTRFQKVAADVTSNLSMWW